ncbi:MAG: hypothetical protein H8E12_14705 [Rhodobacteraceae bacterium]|nr:hypothetical protein [Paracoccaceae bacterium]
MLQNLPAKAIKTIAEGNPNSPFEGNYQLPSVSEDQKNNSPAEFLAYLQDVRYNLNQALIVDSDVYNQCKDIRDTIEENDTFEVLMELWEQLTSNLTGPFAGLGEELSAGNLNSLVNALSEFSAAFSVVGTVGHCVKEFVAPQATTLNLSLDPNMTPEEFALAEQTSAAAKQVQEASDAVLKSLSGISDDEEFNEFLERKEQLKIEFLNESAKINDLLTRLTLLYTMVT